jgi:prepilin-type N-terminal cleavage/methylation domain-containing protein
MIFSHNRQSAFTLIELMVAMVLFATVVAGGFSCLKMGLGLVENSRHSTRACQIMQSEIERIRSLPWGDKVDDVGIFDLPASDLDVTIDSGFTVHSGYDVYTMSRVVTGSGDSRVITLEVEWFDNGGRSHSRTYIAQYTKGGLYDYWGLKQ